MNLEKSFDISQINRCILASNVSEYDISKANACALKFLKGDHIYNELISIPKEERVIRVGKMMKVEPDLYNKIERLLINWRNEFININNIKKENIIEITRDSVMIKNVIPSVTSLHNGIIEFQTKGEEYSSYIYIDEQKRILFDGLRKKIRIKGIDNKYTLESKFVKKCLIPLLQALEEFSSIGFHNAFRKLQTIKVSYINSDDYEIYRELNNKNLFTYRLPDTKDAVVCMDDFITDQIALIDKSSNYLNFILPLMQLKL